MNDDLEPLPNEVQVLGALRTLGATRYGEGVTANELARRLGVQPARRLGNGAVAGTWSGYMAPALRLSPRLLAMERAGLVHSHYGYRSRRLWYVATK